MLLFATSDCPICPFAHELHSAVPPLLCLPSVQSLQAVDPAWFVLCLPAAHGSHCAADWAAAYFPPSHGVHATSVAWRRRPRSTDSPT